MSRQTITLHGGPHDREPLGPVSNKRNEVIVGEWRYHRTDRADAFGRPIFEYSPDDAAEPTPTR